MKIRGIVLFLLSVLAIAGAYQVIAAFPIANPNPNLKTTSDKNVDLNDAKVDGEIEQKVNSSGLNVRYRSGFSIEQANELVAAAHERTKHLVRYDGKYVSLKYPMGDVPDNIGVCTDVIIRSYRKIGIDLQKEVHMDMKLNFAKYPKKWGLKRTDTNIDHRRVPNLRTFFSRKGKSFKPSNNPKDYFPGDLVTWMLPGNLPHIGIVSEKFSEDGLRPLIIHNIGAGPVLEDMLFDYKITGIYRY